MASPDEAADDSVRDKRGKKAYMMETTQCLLFARDNLPGDVYHEFVKTMTEIWKQCADPDGEIRSICAENCIEMAMKIFQGWAPVKQGFLNFTQGLSPFEGDDNVDADVDVNAHMQSPLDFLRRAKTCPDISEDDYATMLQALINFKKRTITAGEVFHIVKGCMSNCPELLEEFTNYLPPYLKGLLTNEKSCRNLKTGRVGKAPLCFTPDANQSLDGTQIKATNMWKEGSEESLLAEEDEEDKVKPLPGWITSKEKRLPPKVEPENYTPCTPSYYLLPHNCITLQSSYRTKLGRSILNDAALVSSKTVASLYKAKNKFEENMIICEDDMFESDVMLQRFRATADFIANLQDRVGTGLRINEHITPLHRRCIQKLYGDYLELDDLLQSQTTSSALSILLSRLNRRVENLSEAHSCLHKILPPLIAKNYYRSLDHHGPSFKQLDAKRIGYKALLAEAKEIHKSRLNAGEEYDNPDIHNDIRRIISSVCASNEKLMITWTKIVHPFLSANCLQSYYLEETVAPSEACEHCGISKDFLSSISDALAANKLPLCPKEGELLRKTYNECSSSRRGFGVEIEEGEFIPNVQTINSDSVIGPGKGPARASRDIAAISGHTGTYTSIPSSCEHGTEPEKKNEPRQVSKRTTKLCGVKAGTCCSLVVLCRLYQILYRRLQTARDLCTRDLYTEFKEQLCRLLDRSIDNCNFEDFCLKFLGPNSFELFTLDIVINQIIKKLCVISSSDSLVQFLEELLRRPILPKHLSHHQNQSSGLLVPEEQDGKLSLHFERRKKRKLEDGASSSSQPGGRDSNF